MIDLKERKRDPIQVQSKLQLFVTKLGFFFLTNLRYGPSSHVAFFIFIFWVSLSLSPLSSIKIGESFQDGCQMLLLNGLLIWTGPLAG